MINATLLVQALNFFIAHLLFRFLLVNPAVQAIQQEQHERDGLNDLVKEREQKLQETTEEKQQAWRAFQEQFSVAAPPVRRSLVTHLDVEPEQKSEPLTPDQVEELAKEVQQKLVKEVQHVRE